MAVLNVVLFRIYLASSRLFHSNGKLKSGEFGGKIPGKRSQYPVAVFFSTEEVLKYVPG